MDTRTSYPPADERLGHPGTQKAFSLSDTSSSAT